MSNDSLDSTKLVDLWFIAGISLDEIMNLKKVGMSDEDSLYEPDILLSYPKESTLISKAHLPVSKLNDLIQSLYLTVL